MCLVFSRLKLDTKLAEELGRQTGQVAESRAPELGSDQERGGGEQVRTVSLLCTRACLVASDSENLKSHVKNVTLASEMCHLVSKAWFLTLLWQIFFLSPFLLGDDSGIITVK